VNFELVILYYRYNDVLVNGLPDWRQPIYYYRKVRKFGIAESSLVLLIIVTLIHYAVIWAAYWERRFVIVSVEVLSGRTVDLEELFRVWSSRAVGIGPCIV